MNRSRQSRKRGVRASRPKLYRALTAAGLRSQAELAERIADIEGLDSAPKSIVSRVFRELPVEPQTLERVARALNTDAFRLYRTFQDAVAVPAEEASVPGEPPAASTAAPPLGARRTPQRVLALAALSVVLGIALVLAWWHNGFGSRALAPALQGVARTLGLGPQTLAVQPFRGDESGAVSAAVRQALSGQFRVASPTAAILTEALNAPEAAARLRTEVTVEGDLVEVGRFAGIRAYLYTADRRRQIWAESLAKAELDEALPAIAHRIANAVRHATGLPLRDEERPDHFPLAAVHEEYLRGRRYLDLPANELNIRRAQAHFEAALRLDANYARAHAGLCESLLEGYWLEDAQRALKDAAHTCGRALQLQPGDPMVRIAQAGFLLRTGRTEEAIETYSGVLEDAPRNASALAGLAASHLQAFRQESVPDALAEAITAARAAADADPLYWKPLFSLAAMRYLDGDIRGAIEVSREALVRDTNEYVLGNLGTYHFCAGELEQARDTYLEARDLAPGSYVGDELLGQLHYQLGDYEAAAELQRRAIDSIQPQDGPEIHEMWGNLADAYWRAGRRVDALAAYRSAAAIAERDFLLGSASIADRASRVWYYTMLATLAPDEVSATQMTAVDAELLAVSDAEMAPSPLVRLANSWLQRGDRQRAKVMLERAVTDCRGYGMTPHLAGLLATR